MRNYKKNYDTGKGLIPLKCLVSEDIHGSGRNVGSMVNELFFKIGEDFPGSFDKPTGVLVAEISVQNRNYVVTDSRNKKKIDLFTFLQEQDRLVYNALVLSHELPNNAANDLCLQFTPLIYSIDGRGMNINLPSRLNSIYQFELKRKR